MILPVLRYPDPRLKIKSEPIKEITPEIKELANNMLETMYAEQGIGLASPQVGVNLRLIVVDVEWTNDVSKKPYVFINPELELLGPEVESEEGCLSVPDFRSTVRRQGMVNLKALDLNGNKIEMTVDDIMAICLQHECDHLDGKLFIDKVSVLKKMMYDKKISRNSK